MSEAWTQRDEAQELGKQLDDQLMQYRKLEEVVDELQHENEYLKDLLADKKPPQMAPNSRTLLPMMCRKMNGITTWA